MLPMGRAYHNGDVCSGQHRYYSNRSEKRHVYMSGTEVAMLRPKFKNDTSNSTFDGTFITMPMFTLSGKSSYVIDGTTDETAKLNVGVSKITITLESDSTLLWTYWAQGNPNTIGDIETYQEIILRRVK